MINKLLLFSIKLCGDLLRFKNIVLIYILLVVVHKKKLIEKFKHLLYLEIGKLFHIWYVNSNMDCKSFKHLLYLGI